MFSKTTSALTFNDSKTASLAEVLHQESKAGPDLSLANTGSFYARAEEGNPSTLLEALCPSVPLPCISVLDWTELIAQSARSRESSVRTAWGLWSTHPINGCLGVASVLAHRGSGGIIQSLWCPTLQGQSSKNGSCQWSHVVNA